MIELRAGSQGPPFAPGDLWRGTLSSIPTLFGRLTFLAGLRNSETGRYSHPSLLSALGPEEADHALRRGHHVLFGQWIALSLEDQMSDLGEFLSAAGGARDNLHYRDLAPAGAHEIERQLYLTDLETLLELLDASRGSG